MKNFWKKIKNFIARPHCWYMVVALLNMVLAYFYIKAGKELPAILWAICSAICIILAWMYYRMFK